MAEKPQGPAQPKLSLNNFLALIVGVLAAVIYGLITRSALDSVLSRGGALSFAFFCLTPPALGFLTVIVAPKELRTSAWFAISAPWISCVACMLITAAFAWEYAFCIILAVPLFMGLSSLGGLLGFVVWIVAADSQKSRLGALALVVSLPYLSAAVEHNFTAQTWTRRVDSRIEINAPAEVVWANITNLAPIQPEERPVSFYHLIGLPRPVEARMACPRVGCVRLGAWEDGLSFDGVITQIEPGRSYWVSLTADTSGVSSSLAPLKGVGGRTFGMVDDGYEIEPLGQGRTALHLYSTYRVTTRFNAYASLWLDLLLRDIQHSILQVEKTRAERQSQAGAPTTLGEASR